MSIIYRIMELIKNQVSHSFSKAENDFDFNAKSNDNDNDYTYTESSKKKLDSLKQDLDLFEMSSLTSLAELKSKRNEILRKYHPDRFANDTEKQNIAKEMIQIYNAAYERIVKYYSENKDKQTN